MSMIFDNETLLLCLPEPWLTYYRPSIEAMAASIPRLETISLTELTEPSAVNYALALAPPSGLLGQLTNLTAIMPVGAGVEHLLSDPLLPDHIPIVRFVQPDMVMRMSEYVLQHVLNHHRQARVLRANQCLRVWQLHPQPSAAERTVGILGLGVLGQDAALKLRSVGFAVRGWSRTPKTIEGIDCFAGTGELRTFLRKCEILVCLLPLTRMTEGLIDGSFLSELPRGASIINAARGAIIVDDDLLAALESEQISEATLDAFAIEPLPDDHAYWDHPKVTLTPHCASAVTPEALASKVADTIDRIRSGKPLENVVERSLGY